MLQGGIHELQNADIHKVGPRNWQAYSPNQADLHCTPMHLSSEQAKKNQQAKKSGFAAVCLLRLGCACPYSAQNQPVFL